MSRFFDIHTHKPERPDSIYALTVASSTEVPASGLFSAGIHPYSMPQFDMSWVDRLGETARHPRCVALGETGLDLRAEHLPTAKQQIAVFDEHLFLAKKLGKPLVVHSVRALPQVLQRIKEVPFVVHGFVGSEEAFGQIRAAGGSVSLGEKLLHDAALRERAARFDPAGVLLETDDSAATIESIYAAWAEVQQIDPERINEQIERNVQGLFNL